jgi:hypothetical protein
MTTNEEWKPIIGYEGYYEISSFGRVKSLPRVKCKGIIRKPKIDKFGYHRMFLSKNGVSKDFAVHRLVMAAFVGECPNGQEVRHLDGNPSNNHLSNLTYGTKKENQADRLLHGTSNRGQRSGLAKLTEEDVLNIRHLFETGIRKTKLSEMFGVSFRNIDKIVKRETWIEI